MYSTSKSSYHTVAEEEKVGTLVASDYKDPPTVSGNSSETEYIIRRLTPSECAKLQGFPSWWCKGLENTSPTESEIDEWMQIFETYRLAVNPDSKPKTRKAVEKFLKNPHSDSAEYRLWGNGVSLPVVWFVLAGISYYANLGANCERTDIKADD